MIITEECFCKNKIPHYTRYIMNKIKTKYNGIPYTITNVQENIILQLEEPYKRESMFNIPEVRNIITLQHSSL